MLRVPIGLRLCERLTSRQEPEWARNILRDIAVTRELTGTEKEAPATVDIIFEFASYGGWEDKEGGIHEHANYLGYRSTGVGKGDCDAWLTIAKHPDGRRSIELHGAFNVRAFYRGEEMTGTFTAPNLLLWV